MEKGNPPQRPGRIIWRHLKILFTVNLLCVEASMKWPQPMQSKKEGFFVEEARQRLMEIRALRESAARKSDPDFPKRRFEECHHSNEMSVPREIKPWDKWSPMPPKQTRSGCNYWKLNSIIPLISYVKCYSSSSLH